MKTIIIQGENHKFDNMNQAMSNLDSGRLPYEVEIRVYIVNPSLTSNTDDDYLIDDDLFMDEAERQGTVFTLDEFVRQFNDDEISISNSTHYIRTFTVPIQ